MDDQERYEILKKEVDSIQIQLSQERSPWYTKPSNLISIIALLFSFGTTTVSYINSHNEDIRANHREAMALIQRITKLPIENFELMQRNKGSGPGEALSGMINQENILLATQAANLVKRYPDTFTSTEFYAIASALATSNIVDKVPFLFKRAIEKAETSNDYNVATRSYAYYLYSKGDYTEGKKFYETALGVWNKFPERNMYIVNSTDLVTFMYWSQAELMANNVKNAENLIGQAKDKLAQLPPGPMTLSLATQVNYTVGLIEQARAGGHR
jgi:tetratricopeptide (TPR) repeat protein